MMSEHLINKNATNEKYKMLFLKYMKKVTSILLVHFVPLIPMHFVPYDIKTKLLEIFD